MVLRKLIGKKLEYQDKGVERKFHKQPLKAMIASTENGYKRLTKDYYYYNIIKNELELEKKDYVLDLGCSGGVFEILFKDYDFEGIDISPDAIKVANLIKKKYKLRANFSVGDAENLKFKDNTFDKVFCFATLHHLPPKSLEKAIAECYRVLKKGGIMVSIEPNLLNIFSLYEHVFNEYFSQNEFPYSPTFLEKEFLKHFRQVKTRTIKYFPKYNKSLETVISHTPVVNLFGHKILMKAVK